MTIPVTCQTCEAAFQVKVEYAGKRGKCPRCQSVILIPNPPGDEEAGSSNQASTPTQSFSQTGTRTQFDPPQDEESSGVRRLSEGESEEVLIREILQSFQGEIQPVKRTAGYHVGIAILTILMLLMPLLYFGFIAAIGYFLIYHATHHFASVAQMHRVAGLIFLYVGPLVAGVVLLFFMVKPLFASRSRSQKLRTLEFGQEPLLFALVTRIAKAVGAPEPKRINIDCQVNASASFGSGLGGLFGKDLVLTLGLPLVAGLRIQHLVGVIAHELGHFSQGTAMRLNYLVREINLWFYRMVHERDDWDEALARGCDEENRMAIVWMMAMLCVWLTRRVLWIFTGITHGLSCFMLRQMEYDADRYEARLAGTKAFIQTQNSLVLLGVATEIAHTLAANSLHKRQVLPDDLSVLIMDIAGGISPETIQKLEQEAEKSRTGLFDTHPAHGERIASARKESAPGLFHLEGPATELFRKFAKMSRSVTMDFYKNMLGKLMKRITLVPTSAFIESAKNPESTKRELNAGDTPTDWR